MFLMVDRAALFHRFDCRGLGSPGADDHSRQQISRAIQRRLGPAERDPLCRRGLAGLELDNAIDLTEVASADSVSNRMACSLS